MFKTFGKNPEGARLAAIQLSPNYRDGSFQNLSPTDMKLQNTSMLKVTWQFFNKPRNTAPPGEMPVVKTDLKNQPSTKPTITWFGHSSYLVQINGKNILVDPVFSGRASPFAFAAKSFPGTDIYSVDDLPEIDMLLLTHDHYDHLDYKSVLALKSRVKSICTSLGVGAHLEFWGVDPHLIKEFDWWDSKELGGDLNLTAAPARHFSGRTLVRNKTLWSSFILESNDHKIYIGSDSGYDSHFRIIGEKFGPFDLVILETGQYNDAWPLIHMTPEEAVQACVDLRGKLMLPVHWGRFAIALHSWDEPVKRVLAKARELNVVVTTPRIGEKIELGSELPVDEWWLK